MTKETSAPEPVDPMKPYKGRFESHSSLPGKGRSKDELLKELTTMADEENAKWQTGQVSGTFYHAGAEHRKFLNEVFSLFSHENTLQFDLCPSMFKMESEIISMTAKMLNADAANALNPEQQVVGTVNTGGTESIMQAMKVYRDQALEEKGITQPEIIKPVTAHPAFDKAGQYYGIKIVNIPVSRPDFRVDPAAVEKAINSNTVALVGSAGNYPYGLIDPIDKLSDIALKHKIGLHVDGCLGGFILPWIEKLGYDVATFDFRLPGVTSISADTHKYGFALKGTSVVLYRNNNMRRYQYFNVPDWSGGMYTSPTTSGSKSGGLTAAAWASMMYLGEEGYLKGARAIMDISDKIRKGIEEIPELTLIGNPNFVLSFLSDEVDVYHINDFMKAKGWRFNVLQLPPALHFCITMPQTYADRVPERFLEALKEGVEYAKDKAGTTAETTAVYGVAGTTEGNQQVRDMTYMYIDHLYSV